MKKIKENNKIGFTLVELLAVIAILAILVIIVIPNVLQLFNESKMKVFKSEAQTIYKTAESDLLKRAIKNNGSPTTIKYSSCKTGTGYAKIDLLNQKDLQYYIEVNTGGIVKFEVSDGTFKIEQSASGGDVVTIQEVISAEANKNNAPVTDCSK